MKTIDIYFEIEKVEKEDAIKQFEEKYPELTGVFTEERLTTVFHSVFSNLGENSDIKTYDFYDNDTNNYYYMEVLYGKLLHEKYKVLHVAFKVILREYSTPEFETISRHVVYDNSYKGDENSELESIQEVIKQIEYLSTHKNIFYYVCLDIISLYEMLSLKKRRICSLQIGYNTMDFLDIYRKTKDAPCFCMGTNVISRDKISVYEFIDFVIWFYITFHLKDFIDYCDLEYYVDEEY